MLMLGLKNEINNRKLPSTVRRDLDSETSVDQAAWGGLVLCLLQGWGVVLVLRLTLLAWASYTPSFGWVF